MPDTINPLADPTTDTTPAAAATDAPVIPNQYTPPPSTATPNMGGGGVPDTGQPTTPTVMPAGNVPLSQMLLQASAVHHGRIARALNAVGSILGGDTTYHITTNADGSVDAVPQQSTPGEKWGRVAKAALMGAAKGFEVGQGPGGAQRAAAAGVETGMAMPQAQQDQTLALADKMNNQNQQRLMFNANMALLDQRIVTARNENERSGVTFQQQVQDHTLNFAKSLRDMGGEFVNHFKTNEEMAQALQQDKLLQAHLGTNGMTIPLTTFDAKGVPNGIDAWILPEDKRNQLNKTDITIPLMKPDPKNPGQLIEDTPYVIGANTMRLGDVAGAIKSIHDNNNQMTSTAWSALNAKRQTDIKANAPPKEEGTWIDYEDPNTGAPLQGNSKTGAIRSGTQGVARLGTFDRRVAAQEKALGPARDSFNYGSDYVARGNFTGPGDEALMDKFFDLARSSVGFKMSTPQQKMLLDSQSLLNKAKASFAHNFTPNAPYFSTKQRQDIIDTMNQLAVSKGLAVQDGRASLPPLARAAAPTGGGSTDIPLPNAPARPGGKIVATVNGKQGTADANGMFTPDDGSTPFQLPGRNNPAPNMPSRSVAAAMQLPVNQGKTAQQVQQDLINHGYNPVP
jgi:hypothetical protein